VWRSLALNEEPTLVFEAKMLSSPPRVKYDDSSSFFAASSNSSLVMTLAVAAVFSAAGSSDTAGEASNTSVGSGLIETLLLSLGPPRSDFSVLFFGAMLFVLLLWWNLLFALGSTSLSREVEVL
jgi:hypothetical protein